MSILTDIFNSATGGLVSGIGDTVKKFVTTDKDRLEMQLALEKQVQDYSLKLNEQIVDAEAQVTQRQTNDMTSDSWLSKNVRPMILIFLTVMTVVLAYSTIFTLPPDKVTLLKPWVDTIGGLLSMVYGFYFGSRGLEKIGQMVTQTLKK
jgi:hypothetical protein